MQVGDQRIARRQHEVRTRGGLRVLDPPEPLIPQVCRVSKRVAHVLWHFRNGRCVPRWAGHDPHRGQRHGRHDLHLLCPWPRRPLRHRTRRAGRLRSAQQTPATALSPATNAGAAAGPAAAPAAALAVVDPPADGRAVAGLAVVRHVMHCGGILVEGIVDDAGLAVVRHVIHREGVLAEGLVDDADVVHVLQDEVRIAVVELILHDDWPAVDVGELEVAVGNKERCAFAGGRMAAVLVDRKLRLPQAVAEGALDLWEVGQRLDLGGELDLACPQGNHVCWLVEVEH